MSSWVPQFFSKKVTGGEVSTVRKTVAERERPFHTHTVEDVSKLELAAPEREVLCKETNFDPVSSIPSNWAVLHIERASSGCVQGYAFYRKSKLPLSAFSHYSLDFYWKTQGLVKKDTEEPVGAIKQSIIHSKNTLPATLQDLFNSIVTTHPEDATLVIVEHVESRIPWELVSTTQGKLGACSDLARWMMVRGVDGAVALQPQRRLFTGTTASFVAEDFLVDEAGAITELEKTKHERFGSKEIFVNRFKNSRSGLGLIYLAGHGEIGYLKGEEYPRSRIGPRKLEDRSIFHSDVENDEYPLEDLPLVVANACYSGCMRQVRARDGAEVRAPSGNTYGFPKAFLSTSTSAFVGVLGSVEEEDASSIGADFLRRLILCDQGAYPVRLLREMRQAAVLKVAEGEKDASMDPRDLVILKRKMLHTFMYVYYGNPLLQLKVERQEQE